MDGSSSTDDHGIVWSVWAANGQVVAVDEQANVRFGVPQMASVTLTVTDARGATNSITKPFVVGGASQPRVAGFTCSRTAPRTCTFTSTSTDPDGTVVARLWTSPLGTKTPSTASSLNRTFPGPKTLGLKLTVTDNGGATGSVTQRAVVP